MGVADPLGCFSISGKGGGHCCSLGPEQWPALCGHRKDPQQAGPPILDPWLCLAGLESLLSLLGAAVLLRDPEHSRTGLQAVTWNGRVPAESLSCHLSL